MTPLIRNLISNYRPIICFKLPCFEILSVGFINMNFYFQCRCLSHLKIMCFSHRFLVSITFSFLVLHSQRNVLSCNYIPSILPQLLEFSYLVHCRVFTCFTVISDTLLLERLTTLARVVEPPHTRCTTGLTNAFQSSRLCVFYCIKKQF